MPAPYEMKKLYERGELGELEYADEVTLSKALEGRRTL